MGVIAESEWRGGEQKKMEFCEVDMPTTTCRLSSTVYQYQYQIISAIPYHVKYLSQNSVVVALLYISFSPFITYLA